MTMPSPRRVARRNIALLIELGMTRADAARMVTIICDEVTGIVWRQAPDMDLTWLAEIAAEANRVRQQAAESIGAVATYSERVARWAREFDQGHAPSQPCPSRVPHAAHDWWPSLDRHARCAGNPPLERPGA